MQAIAYLRRSTDRQSVSVDRQRLEIEAWAAREGTSVAAWHVEEPMSGSTPVSEREALQAALVDVEALGCDLVCDEANRIGRSVNLMGHVRYVVEQAGGRVVAVDGHPTGDESTDEVMRFMADWAAAQALRELRRRTSGALQALKANGRQWTGHAPYGWRFVDGRLVEDPGEQRVRARILELSAGGLSLSRVCEALEAEGAPARTGRWAKEKVRRVLRFTPPA